jgi:hypothetical protein
LAFANATGKPAQTQLKIMNTIFGELAGHKNARFQVLLGGSI